MAEEQTENDATVGPDAAPAAAVPEPEARARRIRAEEARPGDRVVDRDALQDSITVTKVKLDGGFMLVYGGPQPVQLARREWIWLLPPEPPADSGNKGHAPPDEGPPERK